MKKFLAMILAAMMLLTLAAPLAAADAPLPADGTITIENAAEGVTYSIYRILDLHSYSDAKDAYSYKVNAKWENFIRTATDCDKDPETGAPINYNTSGSGDPIYYTNKTETPQKYFTVDKFGFVTWNGSSTDERWAQLAKDAAQYAKTNSIAAEESAVAGTDPLVFDELTLGYYMIDTTMGTLCSLTTTDKSATVSEKNEAPTIEKYVKEDSKAGTDAEWGIENDAEILQKVEYKTIINVQKGAQNYMLHDTLAY
ncbi:MAG: hypothetical protein IJF67_05160, partial [Clostridia bacterium]|nr:hypothetical protein [Clostridia bacterium]